MIKPIPQGYKQTKVGVIPEDWKVVKLGDVSTIQRGASPRPIHDLKWYDSKNKNVGWVRISDVSKSRKYLISTIDYFSKDGIANSRFLKSGSVIMSICATIGKPIITAIDTCIHDGFVGFSNLNRINKEFLYYLLSKSEYKFSLLGQTGSQANLNSDLVRITNIALPHLEEQVKIAEILTMWDDAIAKQEQLIKKKQLLKKGLMQQIFSQKLRFKDDNGNNYPEWEEKKLGEIIEHFGGTSLEEFSNLSGNYKFISIGNYSTDGQYIDNLQRIDGNNKSLTKLLNIDDLVMVLNDKTHSGDIIGSTILIDKCNTYIYNQRSERIVCKSIVQPKYLWCYLNSRFFRQKVFGISQGGTQIYVNFPFIKKLELLLPSLPEQIKIANFLTTLDDGITNLTEQLKQLQLQKKGLMQQLLTGKVRVKV